jgi:hypothetical protein
MSTRPLGESNTVIRLRTSLENLRSVLVDLEALAHAAWETLDRLPFLPTPLSPRSEGQELESRLNYGRLQALVTATASSAKEVLLVCSDMVESSYEFPVTSDDDDDEGSGSGGAGTPGSSRNGEPGVSGSGNVPQAQAITDAEADVSGSGNVPQARQELIELSFDDIEDGPGDPPSFVGSSGRNVAGTPLAWQSRGGIMLDTAAVPPSLTPLAVADSARIGPQPTAMA